MSNPQVEGGPVISNHCEGHISSRKFENPVSIKNHTALDPRITMEDESEIPIKNRKKSWEYTEITL